MLSLTVPSSYGCNMLYSEKFCCEAQNVMICFLYYIFTISLWITFFSNQSLHVELGWTVLLSKQHCKFMFKINRAYCISQQRSKVGSTNFFWRTTCKLNMDSCTPNKVWDHQVSNEVRIDMFMRGSDVSLHSSVCFLLCPKLLAYVRLIKWLWISLLGPA